MILREAHHEYQLLTREQMFLAATTLVFLTGLGLTKALPILVPWLRSQLRFKPGVKGGGAIRIGSILLRDDTRLRQTHIVGATGTGKSVLLEQLVFQDLARGYGAVIIDPKGDRELYERVRGYCKLLGREEDLHLLSATYCEESVRWNPCRLGNVSELQSKFFNSAIYTEPHYAKACELGLLKAFKGLTSEMADGFTVSDLLIKLMEISQEEKDATIKGLFLDLYNLAEGEWREILCCGSKNRESTEISLLDITRKNEILFVDLPTESKSVQSTRMGRLLLQELMLISGLRKTFPNIRAGKPFSVYIDEFDAFATENFATFLNKGRSSGFMIHMAHQTLSDLEKVGKHFEGQVLGNTNVRFIFRQDDPVDAERWSKFLGTQKVTKKTHQAQDGNLTGMTSNRETQEFKIHPDTIKELLVGECIFSAKTERELKKVRIPFLDKLNSKSRQFPVQRSATDHSPVDRRKSLDQLKDRFEIFLQANEIVKGDEPA